MPEVAGVAHRYVRARGIRFHVAEAGQGPAVVLLHGWPQHWFEWRRVIGPLAERFRVLCPDLRGFGWSDAPAHGYEKEALATDVLALLDAVGVERFRLIGHDWGGWIGFLIALREPERLERLIPLNVAHPFGGPSAARARAMWRFWYQAVIAAPLIGPRVVAGTSFLARWLGAGPSAWSEKETEVFLGQFREPDRARASALLYRSFLTRELRQLAAGRYRRARLHTPTLLLYGTADRVIRPAHIEGYERHTEDMTVELVPGRGHFIVDERPELVIDRAVSFLG
jgi:pimeloyl-ACP methyl ester carboxylesterase